MSAGSPEYKDRLFSFIFGNEAHKEWTLSLYNAINGTHYDNPDDISIETIRQVLYMGMHNDVAFIIADQLSLYEQQSTFNPNMPLRMLEYTANLYEKYIKPGENEQVRTTADAARAPAGGVLQRYGGKGERDDPPPVRRLCARAARQRRHQRYRPHDQHQQGAQPEPDGPAASH